MNDLEFDAKEKKEIARSALQRVGTGDRHGCSLPSDNLTPGQKRKLTGPAQTVQMNKPMTWTAFKDIGVEALQREYLQGLVDTFRVGIYQLGEMMYVSPTSVYNFGLEIGVKFLRKGHKMSQADKLNWSRFLSGEAETGPRAETPVCCPDSPEHINGGRNDREDVVYTSEDPDEEVTPIGQAYRDAYERKQQETADLEAGEEVPLRKAGTLDLATTYDHIPDEDELRVLFNSAKLIASGKVSVNIQIEVTQE